MAPADITALRQVVLAASVLDDIDVLPRDWGVVLPGSPTVEVAWREVRQALAGARPSSDRARIRVASWLFGRTVAAQRTREELRAAARPVGLPIDHVLHPGCDWVRHRVHGGALDVGCGFVGVGREPDDVVLIPQGVLDAAGIDPRPWWPVALHYLEAMGAVAADRAARSRVITRIGDCDAVTLVAARSLRSRLCAADGARMVAASVPMRGRGWLDLSRIDAAFAAAAAAATPALTRGFRGPVLLTRDEVVLAPPGGRPAELVLRDPATTGPRPGAAYDHQRD